MKAIGFSVILFLFFCLNNKGAAQSRHYTTNYNGWFMYFGNHKFSEKWGLHAEAQFRLHDVVASGQQILLRTGLNYHFNDQVFATAGYCFVETFPYGEFAVPVRFPEHRLWQGIQVKTQLKKVEMITRFRLEQRFIYAPVQKNGEFEPGDAVYQNRFRLLTRFSIPFNGEVIEDKSWFFTMYDELFVNFGENVALNIFDQNRAYLALGYKVPKAGRIEVGYLSQLILRSDGVRVENNHTLQVGLYSTLKL
jgi:hypothetical protein